ncbi:N-acyl homoserine lactonase family protein [Sphingomonas sp.]|jgi:glyoxylase-like metal-dependent hydrolase (beta-lactamase superfamily II)|uniref:N-acyl homoserine lactonase family protein n=1 Tax=Sphingomonas sp. TaxID=28214 RepID=UPI002ED938DC
MKFVLALLSAGSLASGFAAYAQSTPAVPKVTLTRLDCGSVRVNDLDQFSDTRAYVGQTKTLTDSCYLIRHGDEAMLWDTGLPAALKGVATNAADPMSPSLRATLVEQLAQIGVRPDRIARIGISHYHFDHIGQAAAFPGATLMIGAGDWAALTDRNAKPGFAAPDSRPLAHWISGGGKVETVARDKDVFGDGTVVMLDMPGHTPGHHALLVRLKGKGAVLLTGDLAHFRENYASNGVPGFNTGRADTLASLDRFKKMAANLKASVIIQHEAADIAKLPAFPASAE